MFIAKTLNFLPKTTTQSCRSINQPHPCLTTVSTMFLLTKSFGKPPSSWESQTKVPHLTDYALLAEGFPKSGEPTKSPKKNSTGGFLYRGWLLQGWAVWKAVHFKFGWNNPKLPIYFWPLIGALRIYNVHLYGSALGTSCNGWLLWLGGMGVAGCRYAKVGMPFFWHGDWRLHPGAQATYIPRVWHETEINFLSGTCFLSL